MNGPGISQYDHNNASMCPAIMGNRIWMTLINIDLPIGAHTIAIESWYTKAHSADVYIAIILNILCWDSVFFANHHPWPSEIHADHLLNILHCGSSYVAPEFSGTKYHLVVKIANMQTTPRLQAERLPVFDFLTYAERVLDHMS